MSNAGKRHMNWAQVRDQIDRGQTGDKIAVGDPAAAPLGTDTEADGSVTGGEEITRSAALQQAGPAAQATAQRRHVARPRRAVAGLTLAAIAMLCIVAAIALALVR